MKNLGFIGAGLALLYFLTQKRGGEQVRGSIAGIDLSSFDFSGIKGVIRIRLQNLNPVSVKINNFSGEVLSDNDMIATIQSDSISQIPGNSSIIVSSSFFVSQQAALKTITKFLTSVSRFKESVRVNLLLNLPTGQIREVIK